MPTEWATALAGGALIGLSAGGFFLTTGRIAGISGIAGGALTGPERSWRWAFLGGLLAAGVSARWWGPQGLTNGLKETALPIVLLAGLLVGLGAGWSNGCTSGHGVCGLARLSPRSLAAVLTFMATAALTVLVARHWFT